MCLKSIQTLRGLCQHWINASGFWQTAIQLLDALLGCADEVGQTIRRNDAEILEGWWNMITFIMYLSARDDIWPCLFRNRLTKLLCLTKRLSGVGITENVLWTSGDDTPTCIDGVNWTNNEYLKILPWDILQEFTNHRQSSHLIAECELAAVVAIVVSWTGPLLTSRILLNGSDNTNVLSWIRKKEGE